MSDTSEQDNTEDQGRGYGQRVVPDVESSKESWCCQRPQALAYITVPGPDTKVWPFTSCFALTWHSLQYYLRCRLLHSSLVLLSPLNRNSFLK